MKIDVFIVNINKEINNFLFKDLFASLSDIEKQSVTVKAKKNDRDKTLVSYLLLRSILTNKFELDPNELTYIKNDFGKPSLLNRPEIQFNISRTDGSVALAISEHPLGIDVEYEKVINFELVQNHFHEFERNYLIHLAPDYLYGFYKIWTMKESYIKALGVGLQKALNSFSVVNEYGDYCLVDLDSSKIDSWSINHWKHGSGNHFSVCSNSGSIEYSLIEYDNLDFIRNEQAI